MTKATKKDQFPASSTIKVTRTRTGGKASVDLFARLKDLPQSIHPIQEAVTQPNPTNTTQPTQPTQPNPSNPTQPNLTPISPTRDFTKIANSVLRLAPELFKGLTERTYDVLYKQTRGAIIPCRSKQLTKGELCTLTGLSENTMLKHITHLKKVGLLRVEYIIGKHEGSIYEVFLPEEVTQPNPTQPTQPTQVTEPNQRHKMSPHPAQKIELVGLGNIVENTGTYDIPKTLLKTNKEGEDDDERYRAAFTDLEKVLNKAVENLTGREATEADKERWKQVADILAAQLELIASRTTISNAPAVLAEHLHRQLNSQRALERMGLITPKEARAAKKESQQNHFAQTEEGISEETTLEESSSDDTIPDLYLCPDCDGTTYWNPDGRGRQAGCPHPRLEQARERAALEEE